jgi:hypothetical protein
MRTINKGVMITCSRKGHRIGRLTKPVQMGDPLKLSVINFRRGQERIQGEPPECKMCGGKYELDGMVHTRRGWLPRDPVMEGQRPRRIFRRGRVRQRRNPDTIEREQEERLRLFRANKRQALP